MKAQSHPVRVRGLKLVERVKLIRVALSHPVRVRGLKRHYLTRQLLRRCVAPCAGAWIETASKQ